jgi:hypothetical protein
MKSAGVIAAVLAVALVCPVSSQTQPTARATATDLYHVNFSKAAPGEAIALAACGESPSDAIMVITGGMSII